jgi:hypothetical protein
MGRAGKSIMVLRRVRKYGLRSFKYFTFNFLGEANGIQGSEKAGREKSQVRNPRLMLSLKSAQSSCPIVIL